MRQKTVLMLMAHTGGGHLRAAEAVAEALRRRHGLAVSIEIVDALGEYAPFPFNRLASFYPGWIDRATVTWDWGYRLTDGRRRASSLLRLFWPLVWPRVHCLLQHHPADVVLSVHPLTNHFTAWALRRLKLVVSSLTLVTDPVSVHPFWLAPEIDRCLVGSVEARNRALDCGLNSDQVRITGLPVNPCFADGLMEKEEARHILGLSLDRPAVLMIGGGEGMGRIYQIARAVDATCCGIQLVVVTGRNEKLRERMHAADWRLPISIYGFVGHGGRNVDSRPTMSCLMSAADLLITKAGPGTLHEAFVAGLPLVLSGAVPGQEAGNVRLTVEGGAGVWAPDPHLAAAHVARWTSTDDGRLSHMAVRSRALAQPDAAAIVADEVWQLALTNL